MAYAKGLLALMPDRLQFAAVHPTGFYGRLPTKSVRRFLDQTERRWEAGEFSSYREKIRFVLRTLLALRPRRTPAHKSGEAIIYLLASPNNLTRPNLIQAILRRENARLVCLVHDLIPLEFPEYARPGGAEKHSIRVQTISESASGVVTNSAATLSSLQPWLTRMNAAPHVAVAHLGTDSEGRETPDVEHSGRPYFVCIGTIEPRKNHLLLLHLWRRIASEFGEHAIPRLIIIGRRGWENEQVVDILERCPSLREAVEEKAGATDAQARALMAGARALLLPSFAEGYGMPIAEALELRVPVICSDLPALREAGGLVPEYLDPLDGLAWTNAVLDYASLHSSRRARQLERIESWTAPTWRDHLDIVQEIARRVAA